mgnify:FL=1
MRLSRVKLLAGLATVTAQNRGVARVGTENNSLDELYTCACRAAQVFADHLFDRLVGLAPTVGPGPYLVCRSYFRYLFARACVAGRCLWIAEGERSRDDFAVALMTP